MTAMQELLKWAFQEGQSDKLIIKITQQLLVEEHQTVNTFVAGFNLSKEGSFNDVQAYFKAKDYYERICEISAGGV